MSLMLLGIGQDEESDIAQSRFADGKFVDYGGANLRCSASSVGDSRRRFIDRNAEHRCLFFTDHGKIRAGVQSPVSGLAMNQDREDHAISAHTAVKGTRPSGGDRVISMFGPPGLQGAAINEVR